eukprot:6811674-Pyramimonas_sp.AAC.1
MPLLMMMLPCRGRSAAGAAPAWLQGPRSGTAPSGWRTGCALLPRCIGPFSNLRCAGRTRPLGRTGRCARPRTSPPRPRRGPPSRGTRTCPSP